MSEVDPSSAGTLSPVAGGAKTPADWTQSARIRPGWPFPLGATWDGQGVNFAFFSESAIGIDVCLFDQPNSAVPNQVIRLTERTDQVWHSYVTGLRPGQRYACRIRGAYDPPKGLRSNSAKLLIDPYAKAIEGPLRWDDTLFGYRIGGRHEDLR